MDIASFPVQSFGGGGGGGGGGGSGTRLSCIWILY